MEKTPHYKGHRWTQDEIVSLMGMWQEGKHPTEIADKLNVTPFAVSRMIVKLRKNGIPLERRRRGHVAGRANTLWTHAEIEYLIRRRRERATMDEIASELGRTHHAVQAMIQKLRSEDVPVPMYGMGVRRLWDPNSLRAIFRDLSGVASEETAAS
jgi:predicted transcriptional regulator